MIEFKTHYTPGPWEADHSFEPSRIYGCDDKHIADVFDGHDANLKAQSVKMAEYIMDKAQELHLFLKDKWLADYPTSRADLDKILSILKDAGVEVMGR